MPGFQPPTWGGQNSGDDYELLMEGSDIISKPVSLVGHALTSPSQELSDPVTTPIVRKIGGKIRKSVKTIRAAQETSLSFTMLFGNGLWTPALHRARKGSDVQTTFIAKRLCPENTEFEHAYIWPESTLNPPVRVNDFITIDDSTLADWQTELRTDREFITWAIGGFLQYDAAAALNAVAFATEDCSSIADTEFATAYAVGGAGGGADTILAIRTDDRFATIDTLVTTVAPVAHTGRAIYTDGDVLLIGFSDALGLTAGVTGGTIISADRGDTFQLDSNITGPIYGVGFFNGRYLAVGGTGAGAAMIYTSENGIAWTVVTSGALPATLALASVAVDNDNGVFYAVGEGGTVLKGYDSAGSVVLVALTPPGSPGILNVVRVIGSNHVVIAGASGYYAETLDGGATWSQAAVPGTSAFKGIAGTALRTMIGAADDFSARDHLNDMAFTPRTLENSVSVTGNITDIISPKDEHNYFLGVTDAGNVVLWKPFFPNS